jgi:hypothetical protein
MAPEAEGPARLQWVAVRKHRCGSGAWAGARRGEAVDAAHLLLHLAGGDAGKLVGRVRDVPEQDASCLQAHRFVRSARRGAVAEPCTRGADRSAEQSCAALEAAADLRPPEALRDGAQRVQSAAQKRQQPKALQERMEQLSEPQAALRDAAAEARPLVTPAQIWKRRAFPPARIQLGAGVLAGQQAAVPPAVVRQQAEPALRPEAQ